MLKLKDKERHQMLLKLDIIFASIRWCFQPMHYLCVHLCFHVNLQMSTSLKMFSSVVISIPSVFEDETGAIVS